FSSTHSCNPSSGMHWSTIGPCSPNCLPLILNLGGKPGGQLLSGSSRPGPGLLSSHWNFTGEAGFLMSLGPGLGQSFKNFGITRQVSGSGKDFSGVTESPATLTKNKVVAPDLKGTVPVVCGAWTSRSARFPAAKMSPSSTMLNGNTPFGTWPLR